MPVVLRDTLVEPVRWLKTVTPGPEEVRLQGRLTLVPQFVLLLPSRLQ